MCASNDLPRTNRSYLKRLELHDGRLAMDGYPVTVTFSRRGVQIGCHFVTYDALDEIHKRSQQ